MSKTRPDAARDRWLQGPRFVGGDGAAKTAGQVAYEQDVALVPLYPDGTPRKGWDGIGPALRDNWERNQTPCPDSITAAVTERARLRADLAKARALLAGIIRPADRIHELYNTPEDSSWHDDLDAALNASARAIEAARAFLEN